MHIVAVMYNALHSEFCKYDCITYCIYNMTFCIGLFEFSKQSVIPCPLVYAAEHFLCTFMTILVFLLSFSK
jgi:hypothetical protein